MIVSVIESTGADIAACLPRSYARMLAAEPTRLMRRPASQSLELDLVADKGQEGREGKRGREIELRQTCAE